MRLISFDESMGVYHLCKKNYIYLQTCISIMNCISQCRYHTRCSSRHNSLRSYFFFFRHQRHLTAFTTWERWRDKIGRTGRTVFHKFENFGYRIRMIDHVTTHLQNLDLITRFATANRWSVDIKTRKNLTDKQWKIYAMPHLYTWYDIQM